MSGGSHEVAAFSDEGPSVSVETERETWTGYLMDIACVRKSPAAELRDRAAVHTTGCSLMGHCVESGFALVGDDGAVRLLEAAATTDVVRVLLRAGVEEGLMLRAVRERDGHEMRTVTVQAIDADPEA